MAQHSSKNGAGDGSAQKEDFAMVEHKIVPTGDEYSVRIYDAPAGGIRILFGQKGDAINIYTKYDDAVAGVQVYDCADKTVLFDAELEVYLQAARTGAALGDCGLSSLVRFGEPDHCAYATFILAEEYIRRSYLKIIGYKGEGAVYSLGWDLPDK
jgi:hypothetical protein